jgi:3-oxoacyl-[acyl-carrier protein] reductase
MLLRHKIAFVTGAAAGIGEGIARLFAAEGSHTYLLDINAEAAESVASSIRQQGGSADAFHADVTRRETIEPVVNHALDRFGRIDILVNNAGAYPRRRFLDMPEKEWDDIQNLNLKGVFHCTKLVLPHMVKQRSGKIVNISSASFHKGLENLTHYVAAKGGMIGFTRSLAREVGPDNIHVNCITPGAIEVETQMRILSPQQMAAIAAQQSLKRTLLPIDVARVCLFLASELSDGMTGQTVNVDGGLYMY